jgi:hypothetical protein
MSERIATETEKQIFKKWFVGRDDLTWTKLHTGPFKLKITTEKIHCTIKHTGPNEYMISEEDINKWTEDLIL